MLIDCSLCLHQVDLFYKIVSIKHTALHFINKRVMMTIFKKD